MKPSRKIIDKPHVLVLKEKHAFRYFHIPDDATLFAVALKIVEERADPEAGCYYKPEPPDPCDLTRDVIEKLPVSLRADAKRRLQEHEEDKRWCRTTI